MMPAITGVEFRQFSAQHHNAQRNWLLVVLTTDQPGLVGLGDASPMANDEEVKLLIAGFVERYLIGQDPLDSEVHWTTLYHDPQARGGRLATTALSGLDIALWDLKGKFPAVRSTSCSAGRTAGGCGSTPTAGTPTPARRSRTPTRRAGWLPWATPR
jgi:L-alanine-DL-glutamate epimerase-like enolase superfamily enzyme